MSDSELLVERRSSDHSAMLVLVQQTYASVQALDKKLSEHMVNETLELAEALAGIMTRSFPDGDGDGHRRHHESVLKQAESRADFWATMSKELAKWGLVGFMGWATYALWNAFLQGPHK